MRKTETHLQLLERFLPPRTFELIAPYFKNHTIHLSLTHERKSVLGDYRNPTKDHPYHRISINLNLNQYSFLITLLHELAHMLVYVNFKNSVAPHGSEWKTQFRHMLIPYLGKHIFPPDVERALLTYLHNPAASTCSDSRLYKALYRYDEQKPGYKMVDELEVGHWFETEEGELFEVVEHLRTRTRCRNLTNKKYYLFHGIIDVKHIRREKKRIA